MSMTLYIADYADAVKIMTVAQTMKRTCEYCGEAVMHTHPAPFCNITHHIKWLNQRGEQETRDPFTDEQIIHAREEFNYAH